PSVPDAITKLSEQPVAETLRLEPTRGAPGRIEPLGEARDHVQLTVSAALREKLDHARELLRHVNPSGDLAVVLERALDLLIDKLERAKQGKADRPRPAPSPAAVESDAGAIPRAVRREVMERDAAQCTFVSASGERCPARGFLELDHEHPRALG